jgi:hypothetical protein
VLCCAAQGSDGKKDKVAAAGSSAGEASSKSSSTTATAAAAPAAAGGKGKGEGAKEGQQKEPKEGGKARKEAGEGNARGVFVPRV